MDDEPVNEEFGLLESFHIDNGELDDIPKHECFVLGVEWQMFHEKLDTGRAFSMMIHTHNVARLTQMCLSRGRDVVFSSNDGSGQWCNVSVAAM